MHPIALMFLGLFLPVPLAITLFLPLYASVFAAVLAIYHTQSDALLDAFTNIQYIISVYRKAFEYWMAHIETVNHFTYSAPLVLLPFVGAFIALWATVKLARAASDYFRSSL